VRAARQGFRLAAVPIATVYAGEPSHFRPLAEVPRFVALFGRLLVAVATGDAARGPARAGGDARRPGAP
jgi:hypothetical protein